MEKSEDFLGESLQHLNKLSKEHQDDYENLDLAPWEREVLDMLHATRLVHKTATEGSGGLSGDDVIALNRTVLAKEYTLNPHIFGRLRGVNVQISYTIDGKEKRSPNEPVPYGELPRVFQTYSQELYERTNVVNRETPIGDVIDHAAWASLELVRFHPFVEGNGRTSRLLVDIIFEKAGLPYITDWGSKGQEYLKTVYRSFKEDNPDLYKVFLAKKLQKSLKQLEAVGPGVAEFTAHRQEQLADYVESIRKK